MLGPAPARANASTLTTQSLQGLLKGRYPSAEVHPEGINRVISNVLPLLETF